MGAVNSGVVAFTDLNKTLRVYYQQEYNASNRSTTFKIQKVTIASTSYEPGTFYFDGKVTINGEVMLQRSSATYDGSCGLQNVGVESVINLTDATTKTKTIYNVSPGATAEIAIVGNSRTSPVFVCSAGSEHDFYIPAGSRTVDISVEVVQRKLEIRNGDGWNVTVSRTYSAVGGTGTLNNGDTIYENDVLRVTFRANSGYTMVSRTVDGVSVSDTSTNTVSAKTGNFIITASARINSTLSIDNGSAYVGYQVFIDNGGNYEQYVPYLDTGNGWTLLS